MKIKGKILTTTIIVGVLLVVYFLKFIGTDLNRSSLVTIVEKGRTNNGFWVIAKKSFDEKNKDELIKLTLQEPNTWNLIKVDEIYLCSYVYENVKNPSKFNEKDRGTAKLEVIDYADNSENP
jgi:hypothetical protein